MRLAIILLLVAVILVPLVVLAKRRFWDMYAVCYDAISVLIPYRQMMADLVKMVGFQQQPARTVRVLVLGCGTGNFEKLALAEATKAKASIEIVGADFSPSMLKRAKRKNQSASVSYTMADVSKRLPWGDQEFDIVVFCNILYVFRDITGIIIEATRILKAGGKLVISDPKPNSSFWTIFWSHLLSGGILKSFVRAGLLIGSVILVPELLLVAVANIVIDVWGRNGAYVFRDSVDWTDLLGEIALAETYSGQNWLISHQTKEEAQNVSVNAHETSRGA